MPFDISVGSDFQIELEASSNNDIEWQTRSRGRRLRQEVTNRISQKSSGADPPRDNGAGKASRGKGGRG